MKTIIIGAGLSGLTAAWELEKLGHEVVVLESRDRVGGRAWSQQLDNGQVMERGGEYIYPDDFEIRKLACEVGIPVLTHNVRFARRTVGNSHMAFAELGELTNLLKQRLHEMTSDHLHDVSIDFLYAEALGKTYRTHPLYLRHATSISAPPELVSAQAVFHRLDGVHSYIEDGGRFINGNQSLPTELASRLAGPVRLESPVAAIDQSLRGVQVRLADGSTVDGDFAVVSVPLPILREMEFGFELTPAQVLALDHRFMGVAAKIAIPVSNTDGDTALQNPQQTWWTWRSMSRDGETRIPALAGFAGGPTALSALDTGNGPDGWIKAVTAMRPEMVIDGDPLLTDWTREAWTRGSYSAPSLGWTPDDTAAFDTAAGRVAIAGEHTGMAQTLNGAVVSGIRAVTALSRLAT
ncbi:NAD(P)/FAD-dependent oxidoreductase [Arthrobacter sp. StoSoilB5]|uniref:flavin monoamine oxidase family protein n=1 Tax=Arthrobacter sp. StoSoilB5 TaxID=2830992 RepID=UPI0023DF0DC1|nr:NAD(P)/FAD-dependent oxidoreductase [Arthrobacter sp. StoSoilB5]